MTINPIRNSTPPSINQNISIHYRDRLYKIVHPIMKEIQFPKIDQTDLIFGQPIDPYMASATLTSIRVCPLFVIDLDEIPPELRPTGWDDPHLCDLKHLQKLSDWIAEECNIPKQTVTFVEAAAAKTIILLKQDPEGAKAIRAGIVHELGHMALEHVRNFNKSHRDVEREADAYAATLLPDGLEGIKIGFNAWQKSLKAVRSSWAFGWTTKILTYFLITPSGNFTPLYFTHGFFEDRIRAAELAVKTKRTRQTLLA